MSRDGAMKIGEVAGRSGVPAKTIRFWEDQHLLPAPARTGSGYRDYDPAIRARPPGITGRACRRAGPGRLPRVLLDHRQLTHARHAALDLPAMGKV